MMWIISQGLDRFFADLIAGFFNLFH